MDIKTLLPRSHVIMNLDQRDRRELLATLAQPLVDDGVVLDLNQFLDDVERREKQITTQITPELAIPHARSGAVRRLGITLGVALEPGVVFDPESGDPCRFFFLIAVPAYAPTAHLTLLQGLVHFIHDTKRMEKFRKAKTSAQLLSLLASHKWPV